MAAGLMLGACATTQDAGPGPSAPRESAYAADPFVPVNLYVNPGDHVSEIEDDLLEHLYEELDATKAFKRIERGVRQWPATLVINYSYDVPVNAAGFLRAIIYGGSLGLIPVEFPIVHNMRVDIFLPQLPPKTLTYRLERSERSWLLDSGKGRNRYAKAAIDEMVHDLLDDIARDRALPRVHELAPIDAGQPATDAAI